MPFAMVQVNMDLRSWRRASLSHTSNASLKRPSLPDYGCSGNLNTRARISCLESRVGRAGSVSVSVSRAASVVRQINSPRCVGGGLTNQSDGRVNGGLHCHREPDVKSS